MAACAAAPVGEQGVRQPRSLQSFHLEGRIALRQDQIRHYAGISWRHAAAEDEILLTTPLGQGLAELYRDARGARLRTADREEIAAADWEDLAARLFGLRLPLNGLPAWLAGRNAAAADGWRIDYLGYESDAADALPVLIELRRGDLEIRVKVDRWGPLP